MVELTKKQKEIIGYIFFLVIGILLIGNSFNFFSISVPRFGIAVIEDSYVKQNNPNRIMQTYRDVDREKLSVGWLSKPNYERISYFKFNIPQNIIRDVNLGYGIGDANLNFFVKSADDTIIDFVEVNGRWSENTLSWNNKPSLGRVIVSRRFSPLDDGKVVSIGGFESFLIRKINEGNSQISIALKSRVFDPKDLVYIRSKEYMYEVDPYLLIKTVKPECIGIESKCNGIYYLECRDNKFENKGKVIGKCGVECNYGDEKCVGKDYYSCSNGVFVNNGKQLNKCDVECIDNFLCNEGFECIDNLCVDNSEDVIDNNSENVLLSFVVLFFLGTIVLFIFLFKRYYVGKW